MFKQRMSNYTLRDIPRVNITQQKAEQNFLNRPKRTVVQKSVVCNNGKKRSVFIFIQ